MYLSPNVLTTVIEYNMYSRKSYHKYLSTNALTTVCKKIIKYICTHNSEFETN